MSVEIKMTNHGLDELVEKMNRLAGTTTIRARVGARPTTGAVWRSRKKTMQDVSRTAGENVIIVRTHAKGRNATNAESKSLPKRKIDFVDDIEVIKTLWKLAINRFMDSEQAADLDSGALQIAKRITDMYQEHLQNSQGDDGKLQPVTEAVRKQKEREVGPGKPVLIRTGQLLMSFLASSKRG
jgi:hypothetical protein